MPTANLTITGSITGAPVGNQHIGPLSIHNDLAGGAVTELSSVSGDNTITVPSGGTYRGALIVPPVGNTAVIKIKGAAGDTGVSIHPTDPYYHSMAAGVTSFILNVNAASVALEIKWV